MKPLIYLETEKPADLQEAQNSLEPFEVKPVSLKQATNSPEVWLYFKDGTFQLNTRSGLKLKIDFLRDLRYRRASHAPHKELLSRACGWHLGHRTVLDLTSGLGTDSVFLSQAGFQVKGLERNPYIFILLKESLNRVRQENSAKLWKDLEFVWADAKAYLEISQGAEGPNEPAEILYYDPMFPGSNKSALPGKEMQIFRLLLREDLLDTSYENSVLERALTSRSKLLVFKRPLKAPEVEILDQGPHRTYAGKLIRYDVYEIKGNR